MKTRDTWCVLVHGVTESDSTQQLKNKYWRENPTEMQINYIEEVRLVRGIWNALRSY